MTIGEVSEKAGLPASTLRYYEKNGLLSVSRDSGGRRDYTEADIRWIQFIRRLKETGMPLKDIRRYARLRAAGDGSVPERLDMLRAHRSRVLDQRARWNEYLENLERKIALYERALREAESPR